MEVFIGDEALLPVSSEFCVNRPEFPLAVTISVDNRRLVARLVPAGNRTEAEVARLDKTLTVFTAELVMF